VTAAHRPSQRTSILDAGLSLLRDGGAISLDSVARAAGVTKPGLMYHFATKEALVSALVEHRLDDCERELEELLSEPGARASFKDRVAAYVRWAVSYEHDAADLLMLTDPRLRDRMTERWSERLRPWLEVPASVPDPDRARLIAVRLIADGCWFADVTGILPVPAGDRAALLAAALDLLEGVGE
jgi:AcrR family transcriptional regulator